MKKPRLKTIAQEVHVTGYMDYRGWLYALYTKAKDMDSSYSYAHLSLDISLGSSNANLVISGKRDLTLKTGTKVAESLGLSAKEKKFLLALIAYDRAKGAAKDRCLKDILALKSKLLPNELDKKKLTFFSHWYNAAIIELLRLPQASDDPEWISKSLSPRVPLPKIKRSLKLLKDLNYLAHNKKHGRLAPTDTIITTGNEADLAIASFHQQMLNIARHAIDDIAAELREVSAVTLSVTPELRDEFKQEIIKLRKRMIQKSTEIAEPNEVIQVNFQLFPLVASIGEKTK